MKTRFIFLTKLYILVLLMVSSIQCFKRLKISMPDVHPTEKESYLCTYKRLPRDFSYAYKFHPIADENTAHHMLVFACDKPAHFREYWNCQNSSPCRGNEKIIYAWAKNAPELALPKHVGIPLGEENMFPYIVTQIHYSRPLKEDETDSSGVMIYLTYNIPRYFSSIYLLAANEFQIPPNSVGYHADVACHYRGPTIKPFAFRTHAHARGRSISAYRIRNGKWTLIGIGDPQKPQAFYNIEKSDRLLIKDGDIVAARCTYDSKGISNSIEVGSFSSDEMCNFYMMYFAMNSGDEGSDDPPYGCDRMTHSLEFPADSEFPYKKVDGPTQSPNSLAISTNKPIKTDAVPASIKTILNTTNTTTTTKTTKSTKTVLQQYTPIIDKGWKIKEDIRSRLGEITSVEVTPEDEIVVFHRGDRKLKFESFDEENNFIDSVQTIGQATIMKFNANDGTLMESYGKNTFYLPGGMTVDKKGMFWVTDLGSHQVFKISPANFGLPLMTLGSKAAPGSDLKHFCGPYDVIVDESENIFVADGYCNRRVVKFNSTGNPVAEFGKGNLRRPQSLAIDTQRHRLYVMDQGTSSIHVFNTDGLHIKELKHDSSSSNRLVGLAFSPANDGILFTANDKGSGHVMSAEQGNILLSWNTAKKTGVVSALGISNRHNKLFVARKHPSSIVKYDIYKANSKVVTFPWAEITTSHPTSNTGVSKEDSELNQRIDSTSVDDNEDVTIVPAVVVVAVLATPVLLVLLALFMQHARMRRKVKKAAKQRQLNPGASKGVCGCCCTPPRYYYGGNNRDFDKLVRGETDDSTDDEEEDLFSRKA